MIIGIDASRANHSQKTGVEWYAWHIIEQLKKIVPEDVRVVLYSDVPLAGELGMLPGNWESKVLRWPPRRFWTQVRMSLEMLIHPPDVLFIPAHVFPIIHPKKTVMTVHDVAAVRFPETYNWFERWYSVASARYAMQKLWRAIVPSQWVKKELLRLDTYETLNSKYETNPKLENKNSKQFHDTIKVVHHGYDTRYRKIVDTNLIAETLKKYAIRKPFILSMGRLEEKKNTAHIIQAFDVLRKNHDVQLVLVGKPGYGYEKVEAAIAASPYKNDIVCPGWTPPEEAVLLMNAAEVFLFPSLAEGFGMPVLEAMAAGTPVVASRGSSLEEVGGEAARYVDAGNVSDIANALEDIVSHPEVGEGLRQKGLERVEQFSWEKAAKETFQLLIQV